MQTSLLRQVPLTDNISSFYFARPAGFDYTAGQFIELTLSGHQEDGRPAKRWFTLASSPSQSELMITTRRNEHSVYKRALFKLEPAVKVDVSQPMGDFVLPKLIQTPLIWLAGGIGITPFNSQLQWLADTGEQRPIQMLWSVRTEDDIIFQETLEHAKQHATIVVSEPSNAWGGERGRLTAEQILSLTKPGADSLIYISGPDPFVDSFKASLVKAGISRQQLITDGFPGYAGL